MGLQGPAGSEEPCRPVTEHVLSTPAQPHAVKITCGSKARGDKIKESKGPLAGDQAWLPLQKPQHGQGVGHAAGRWEQPLSPVQGSSGDAGKGPAADFGRQGPELVACRGAGRVAAGHRDRGTVQAGR